MNTNDYSTLQSKKSSADSGHYGNGSASRVVQAANVGYGAGGYARQAYPSAYAGPAAQPRAGYDAPSASSAKRQDRYSGASYDYLQGKGYPKESEPRANASSAPSYRSNDSAANGSGGARNGSGNGGNGSGSGGNGSSNGRNGSGNGGTGGTGNGSGAPYS